MADKITTPTGTIDVTVRDNTTDWNVSGNPVWDVPEFNIASGSTYNISGLTQGASLALLVNGGKSTNIFGTMNLSNLDFILQNVYGINIGATGLVNVTNGNFIATTLPLNLDRTNFLSHQYEFEGDRGFILNEGRITGHNADLVALVANAIENKGTIEVPSGTVALAAGNLVTVGISGDGMVSIGVDEATANSLGLEDQIKNSGSITANGGRVVLDAKAIDGLFDKAINIEKNSDSVTAIRADDGSIEFWSLDDVYNDAVIQAIRGTISIYSANGSVTNAGTLDATRGRIEIGAMGDIYNEAIIKASKGMIFMDSSAGGLTNTGEVRADSGKIEIQVMDDILNEALIQASNGMIFMGSSAGGLKNSGEVRADKGAVEIRVMDDILNEALIKASNGTIVMDSVSGGTKNTGEIRADGGRIDIKVLNDIYNDALMQAMAGGIKLKTGGGDVINAGKIDTDTGRISVDAGKTGTVLNTGSVRTKVFDEKGYTFRSTGELLGGSKGGTYSYENVDGAANLSGSIGANQSDVGNLIVTGAVTLTGDVTFRADSNANGNGIFTMNTGTSIAGGGHNLTIYSGQNRADGSDASMGAEQSVFKTVSGVNTLTLNSSNSSDTTYNANLATAGSFSINTMKTNYHSIFTRNETSGGYQLIFSASDAVGGLQYMDQDLAGLYKLANNVDATETVSWNSGAGFDPVGANTTPFTGTFDGDSKTITNLTINRSTNEIGLFGYVGATGHPGIIRNVGLVGGNVTGSAIVGSLVGSLNYLSTIENSFATVAVTGSDGLIGGLAGDVNSSFITNSYATGSVTGRDYVGGLAGYVCSSSITDSYATGAVSGNFFGGMTHVGGLAGEIYYSSIMNSYATGAVTGSSGNVGGLAGFLDHSSIQNSYATGAVTGSGGYAGGLAGKLSYSSITNSYAIGDVLGGDSYVGGLVGVLGLSSIMSSYSTGAVTGTNYVGGLAGNVGSSSIMNSYATGAVKGSGGVIGGLAGYLTGSSSFITNSYSTGAVTGNANVGGFLGYLSSGALTNNYWFSGAAAGVGNATPSGVTKAASASAFYDSTHPVYQDSDPGAGSNAWDFTVDGSAAGTGDWIMAGLPHLQMEWSETITNLAQLQMMALDLDANYTLANNIDATATSGWNPNLGTPQGFAPVGNGASPFIGTFDGDSKTITGLTINRPSTEYVGLFGNVGAAHLPGVIRNIGLVDANVTGHAGVGGLAGSIAAASSIANSYVTGSVTGDQNAGGLAGSVFGPGSFVENSYATADVSGTGEYLGGLVGYAGNASIANSYATGKVEGGTRNIGGLAGFLVSTSVTNCYSTGNVTGTSDYVGGLVGYSGSSSITNSYATGTVVGLRYDVGGLVGYLLDSSVTNSYATGDVTGIGNSVGGLVGFKATSTVDNSYFTDNSHGDQVDKGTYEHNGANAFSNSAHAVYSGWDFTADGSAAGTGDWIMAGLPHLQMEWSETITNLAQLQMMALDLDANYTLANNIDASATSSWNWNGALHQGFAPVGTFTGVFDGDSKTITGLTINRPLTGYVGLFNCVGTSENSGVIKNVGLVGGSLTGASYVGGLAGSLEHSSSITNSYVTGAVTGDSYVGGLAGYLSASSYITDSYATGAVAGTGNSIGGLAGYLDASSYITNSYATGAVTGNDCVGGLAGNLYASSITNSYAAGVVTGSNNSVGGLVGYLATSSYITNSYATGAVTGGNIEVGGLVGLLQDSSITNSYATGSVTGRGSVGGLVGYYNSGTLTNNWWFSGAAAGVGNAAPSGVTKAASANAFYDSSHAVYQDSDPGAGSNAWDFTVDGSAAGTGDWIMAGLPHLQMEWSETITNLAQLQMMSLDLDANYTLANNIDATATSSWNWNGAVHQGFAPVGIYDSNNPELTFTGSFDGNSHAITNLTINRPSNTYATGLFGFVGTNSAIGGEIRAGTIRNVGLVGGSIVGNQYVGGLAGYLDSASSVTNSYSTANVSGFQYVGGLAGGGRASSSLANSYATGDVTASLSYSGGLVGQIVNASIGNCYATGNILAQGAVGGLVGSLGNSASVTNSYATGNVTGTLGQFVGGLIGHIVAGGAVTNSYFTDDTHGDQTDKGEAKTLEQMKDQSTFTGWDFTVDGSAAGSGDWIMAGLPHLQMEWSETITNLAQLQMMALDLDANYTLANNIDATATSGWNPDGTGGFYGFAPVGNDADHFTGVFDGNSKTITNLTIDRSLDRCIGLFGYVGSSGNPGIIKNVGLVSGNITGQDVVGSLVGALEWSSSVTDSYATGNVTGARWVGGLVGVIEEAASVANSYATGNVSGSIQYAGGLAGVLLSSSSVMNSYATGSVTGMTDVGGFSGWIGSSSITNSYATGAVTGSSDVGGFIGHNDSGALTNNYWFSGAAAGVGNGTPSGVTKAASASAFYDSSHPVYQDSDPGAGNNAWDFTVDGSAAGTGDWIMAGLPHLQMEWSETITNLAQLQMMALDLDASYTLANNIDATVTSTWNSGKGFDPVGKDLIGDGSDHFTGAFDGNSKTITNLTINRPTTTGVGLFGYVGATGHSGVIQDVGLVGGSIIGLGDTGGLAGNLKGSSITNSYVTATVTGGSGVGGLAGYLTSSSSILNSYATGNVSGVYDVGGLAGYVGFSSVTNSYATGSATAGTIAGGLVGELEHASISNSYATGTASAASDAGGLVGISSVGNVTNSYFTDNTHGLQTGKGSAVAGANVFFGKSHPVYSEWDFVDTWNSNAAALPTLAGGDGMGATYAIAGSVITGLEIYLAINGAFHSSVTSSGGAYSFSLSSSAVNAGDLIMVYIHNNPTNANSITKVSGTGITGLDLTYDTLTLGNGGAISVTSDEVLRARVLDDSNMLFSVGATNVSLQINGNLLIRSNATFNLYGDATISGNLTNQGDFVVVPAVAPIDFNGSGTQWLNSGGANFWNVTHSGTGTLKLSHDLQIDGLFYQTDGTYDANGYQTTVAEGATIAGGTYIAGSGTQTFNAGLFVMGEDGSPGEDVFQARTPGVDGTNGRNASYIAGSGATTITGDLGVTAGSGAAGGIGENNLGDIENHAPGGAGGSGGGATFIAGSGLITVSGDLYVLARIGGPGGNGGSACASGPGGAGGAGGAGGSATLDIGSGNFQVAGNISLASFGDGAAGNPGEAAYDGEGNVIYAGGAGGLGGSGGDVSITGTLDLTGSGTQNFHSEGQDVSLDTMTHSGTGTVLLNSTLKLNNALNITRGVLDANNNAIQTGGDWTDLISGGKVTHVGTVTLTGAGSLAESGTFKDLTINGSRTVGGDINATNNITLGSGATVTLGGNTTFNADSDSEGSGAFTMTGATIDGVSGTRRNLTLKASDNSTIGTLTNIGTLEIARNAAGVGDDIVFNGSAGGTDDIDVTTFKTTSSTANGVRFSKTVGTGADAAHARLIYDVSQLQGMSNDLTLYYKLANNVDASSTASWNWDADHYAGFAPVGYSEAHCFAGTFDGDSKTITSLTINRSSTDTDFVGLFGYVGGFGNHGTIQNIGLVGGSVSGRNSVGPLVGALDSSSSITDSYATGEVTGYENVGGLVGWLRDSSITDSYATGAVSGEWRCLGGLAGQVTHSSITNSYATGAVTGERYVGGFTGYAYQSSITNSYATGAVTGGGYAGGFAGLLDTSSVTNSYATGAVTGGGCVGGLAGYLDNSSSIINSYATGVVSGSNFVGGLAGYLSSSSSVTNSYATGTVTGAREVGGLAGYVFNSSITNSYATGAVTGSGDEVGGLAGGLSGSSLSSSYATGEVTGDSFVGGLIGGYYSGSFANNYWFSGAAAGVGNGTFSGVTKAASSSAFNSSSHPVYTGADPWDFTNIWQLPSGAPPHLRMETPGSVFSVAGLLSGLGAGIAMALSVNGGMAVTTTTTSGGAFSFASVVLSAGQKFLIYINDNDNASHNANLVGVVQSAANISGLLMYDGRLSIGDADGVAGTAFSNATLGSAYLNNPNVYYSVDGGTTALTLSGIDLWVPSGVTFTPGASVTVTGTNPVSSADAKLNIEGIMDMGGTSALVTSGNWSNLIGGNKVQNVGTVTLMGNGSLAESGVFMHLTISGDRTIESDISATGNITLGSATTQTLSQNRLFSADSDSNGSGMFSMASDATINGTGARRNLRIKASDNSTIGIISNVGTLEIARNATNENIVFSGNANDTDDIDVTTFKTTSSTANGVRFSKAVGTGADAANARLIYDVSQLQGMSNDLTLYYKLANNIDASSTANWNPSGLGYNYGFAPVGYDDTHPFTGTFNGDSKTIANLAINCPSTGYAGLFGWVGKSLGGGLYDSGVIQNVGLVGGSVTGDTNVGGVAGVLSNNSSITNSYATCDVFGTGALGGGGNVGGLVGLLTNNSSIQNSYATGSVSGGGSVNCGGFGGLVGGAYNTSSITNSYATGDVTGVNSVGGLVGVTISSFVANSYATGGVSGSGLGLSIGGLVGGLCDSSSITNSYATGNATGIDSVGGLVGYIRTSTVTNSYFSGLPDNSIGTYETGGASAFNSSSHPVYTGSPAWDFTDVWQTPSGAPPLLRMQTPSSVFSVAGLLSGLGAGISVALSLNGGTPVTTTTTSGGAFSFGSVSLSAGQKFLIYINDNDNDAHNANLVGMVQSAGNISGLLLYDGRFSIGGAFGVAGTNFSNVDLGSAYRNNPNVYYSVDGSHNLTLNGIDLWVPSGVTFTPGASVTVSGTNPVSHVDAGLNIQGVMDMGGTNALSTSGNWSNLLGGNKIQNIAAVILTGTGNSLAESGVFKDLTIDGSRTIGSDINATGDITISSGTQTLSENRTFSADSDSSGSGAFLMASGATIDGVSGTRRNLTIKASDNSTIGIISNIGTLEIARNATNENIVFSGNANDTDDIDVTTFKTTSSTATGVTFSKTVGTGADAANARLIYDVSQLQGMNNDLTLHYKLANNVNASSTSVWNSGDGFVPVGYSTPFTGDFDGDSKTIIGLTIDRGNTIGVGLFSSVSDATIQDVELVGGTITGWHTVGSLIGNDSGSTIANCYSSADVFGGNDTGGLIGKKLGGSLENSHATGNVSVTSGDGVGGLVGTIQDGAQIINSYATGSVSGVHYVGGLVGLNQGNTGTNTIENSYASGNVTGLDVVGGLVGCNADNNSIVRNSYATGSATATGPGLYNASGGLVGTNSGQVVNCYSIGLVAGNYYGSGLIGAYGLGNIVTNSFYNSDTSGPTHAYAGSWAGTPKTTAEMKAVKTYADAGWNIQTLWATFVNAYPHLQYEPTAGRTYQHVWQGDTSADWSDAANWVGNSAPVDVSDTAYILSGINFDTTTTSAVSLAGLEIYSGLMTLGGGLTVSGAMNVAGGTYNANGYTTGVTGLLTVSGGTYVAGSGTQTYGGLTVSDGNYNGSSAAINVTGDVTQSGGTIDAGTSNISAGGHWNHAGGTFNGDSGTVRLAGTGKTVTGGTFKNLTVTGSYTQSGALSVSGIFNLNGGTFTSDHALSFNAHDFRLTSGSFNRFDGSGTSGDPYLIYDVYGLQAMKLSLAAHYKVAADFSAAGTVNWNGTLGFDPVGFGVGANQYFSGSFDGDLHTISNLTINRGGEGSSGLFGVTDGGTMSNTTLTNVSVSGNDDVGGLAGVAIGTTITNCYVSGNVTGDENVGGLVGRLSNSGVVTGSNVAGTVSGTASVGGLVGSIMYDSSITNSYATGSVTGGVGGGYIGGLVGQTWHSSISNSYASGNVTGSGYAGGLVGFLIGDSDILNSYASGDVSVSGNGAGGLVGVTGGGSSITNSYATGSVSGDQRSGGLVGHNTNWTTIVNSYSTGLVIGNSDTGGLVGVQNDGATTTDSFYDSETSHQADNGIGTSRTTAQMQDAGTYAAAGWDIQTIWAAFVGTTPHLQTESYGGTYQYVWKGNSSTSWSDGANWVGGSAPNPSGTAYVLEGLTFNPTIDNDVPLGGLNIYGGTTKLANNLTILGSMNIVGGTLDVLGTYTINVSGDWSNAGSFSPSSSTVILNGGNQTISGLNVFWNLSKTNGGGDTLTFQSGAFQSILGTLTLKGTGASSTMTVKSSSSGTAANLSVPQTYLADLQYLGMKDINNSSGTINVTGKDVTDNGNNTGFTGLKAPPSTNPVVTNPVVTDNNAVNQTINTIDQTITTNNPVVTTVPTGLPTGSGLPGSTGTGTDIGVGSGLINVNPGNVTTGDGGTNVVTGTGGSTTVGTGTTTTTGTGTTTTTEAGTTTTTGTGTTTTTGTGSDTTDDGGKGTTTGTGTTTTTGTDDGNDDDADNDTTAGSGGNTTTGTGTPTTTGTGGTTTTGTGNTTTPGTGTGTTTDTGTTTTGSGNSTVTGTETTITTGTGGTTTTGTGNTTTPGTGTGTTTDTGTTTTGSGTSTATGTETTPTTGTGGTTATGTGNTTATGTGTGTTTDTGTTTTGSGNSTATGTETTPTTGTGTTGTTGAGDTPATGTGTGTTTDTGTTTTGSGNPTTTGTETTPTTGTGTTGTTGTGGAPTTGAGTTTTGDGGLATTPASATSTETTSGAGQGTGVTQDQGGTNKSKGTDGAGDKNGTGGMSDINSRKNSGGNNGNNGDSGNGGNNGNNGGDGANGKDSGSMMAGRVLRDHRVDQSLSRALPFKEFFSELSAPRFSTNVRVMEGAVYVLDGLNNISLLGPGELMRINLPDRNLRGQTKQSEMRGKPAASQEQVTLTLFGVKPSQKMTMPKRQTPDQTAPVSGPKEEFRPEIKPELMAGTGLKPPATPEVKSETKTELIPEAKPALKAEPEPEPAPSNQTRIFSEGTPVFSQMLKDGTRYATLKKPGRDVFIRRPGGEWIAAEDGMVILAGDEVRTAKGGSVEVVLDGGKIGTVNVSGGSLFRINKAETDAVTGDKTTLLDLALGKILVKVERLKGNSRFEVKTPTALTGVRGTVFEVTVKER